MKQTLEINIDKLVLNGFSPHQKHHIRAAIQAELQRLFTQQSIPQSLQKGGLATFIDAGSFNMQTDEMPKVTGNNIASAIFRGITNGK